MKLKILFLFLICKGEVLHAHEIFTPRADLALQGGFNVDALIKHTKAETQRETEYLNRFMYGITEYLTIEGRFPVFFEKKISEQAEDGSFTHSKACGAGKLQVTGKFRIYHNYAHQQRDQIVLIAGIILPTSRRTLSLIHKKPIIDNDSFDFLFGAASAFETLTFYHFASLTFRANTSSRHITMGNKLLYSYTFGYRPTPPEMDKTDWVFLVDVDGIWTGKTNVKKCTLHNSGGNIVFIGPSAFCSNGNFMIKASAQVPLFQHVNGHQEKYNFRALIGAFLQF